VVLMPLPAVPVHSGRQVAVPQPAALNAISRPVELAVSMVPT
jgi:hypothetical protein